MRFNGAIFDVDGVLVDSPHERAWRESLQRLMTVAWTDLANVTGYTPEKFTTEVYQTYVAGKPREAGARAALEHFGIPDPDGTRVAEYMAVKQADLIALIEHKEYICRHGDDMPEIAGWSWGQAAATAAARSTEGDNV